MMRRTLLVLILFIKLFFYGQSTIPFVDTEIIIDGKFEEEVWSQLPVITDFHNLQPTDIGLAKNQTEVKLFHNGEKLFIQAIYNDSTSKVQVSSLKRDVSIFLSDAFIIVLDTQNQKQNGYLFAVNSLGTQVDGLIERTNSGYGLNFSWNAIWETKTFHKGNKKQYELAIPLKSLNYDVNNSSFGIQMYVRDIKNNSWTILTDVSRNYATYDLRFTRPFIIRHLSKNAQSRFAVTPSVTFNYRKEIVEDIDNTDFTPSMDMQYNITSSLKLDATINPDFSQIDVDQQVTNLTRFSLFFPERRNFFLENADLFSNLGVDGVNPFYSRRIGAKSNIEFGVKLSGNITPKTRVGFLDVQTEKNSEVNSQNYATLVGEQQLNKNFTATGYLINRQETENFNFKEDYNRVVGANLNFKSNNSKWISLMNLGKSFSDAISGKNNFYNVGVWYNRKGLSWNASLKKVEKNYLTDVGFTPRLYNYDAIKDEVIREGYTQSAVGGMYTKFYEKSKNLNSVRYVNYMNNTYFDEIGSLIQTSHSLNSAVFFKNLSAIYYVFNYDDINLKYSFDVLNNGNSLQPNKYNNWNIKLGYNSANNQSLRYRFNIQKGKFYEGNKTSGGVYINYQLLPFANIEASYDLNYIDLQALGKETFHLARLTGEIFFNNRLNWTTYVQYNNQQDNFNINSRLQWEYKPLSYVYFVVTDNLNEYFEQKNWGVAFKMNYRFDF